MASLKILTPIVLALFLMPRVSYAQGVHFQLVADAPITTTVVGMTQDRRGFLWLATQDGLFRYDGHHFIAYRHDPRANSLTSDNIQTIAADSAGFLWLAPFYKGLDRFDPATGVFKHYGHDRNDPTSLANDTVNALLTDHTGALWIATYNGLDRLEKGSDKFIHYKYDSLDEYSLSCDNVRVLYEDRDSVLWIGTGSSFRPVMSWSFKKEGGLNKFNRKTGKFTRFKRDENDANTLIDNRVTALFEDSRGTFWVGTAGDGLHTMNTKTGVMTRHPFNPSDPGQLSRSPVKSTEWWLEDFIPFIAESFDGRILIGSFSNGIKVYDPATRSTTWYGSDSNATTRLPDNLFWKSFTGRDKTVWIGSWGCHLYKVSPEATPIVHHKGDSLVLTIMEDENETLWMGSLNGLVKKEKNGRISRYLIDATPCLVCEWFHLL